MHSWVKSAVLILAASYLAASVTPTENATCTSLNKRKSWNALTNDEKSAYIKAELCLMKHPPVTDTVEGAKSVWDEMHYTHINQGNYIHYVGHFLPWHRYFVRTHEFLLQNLCNYTGAHPYWDELTDLNNGPLNQSSIFDPVYGFGGNGHGENNCVADGPFKNMTLHMRTDSNNASYCLYRQFDQTSFEMANSTNLNECYNKPNYTTAWSCYNGYPHGAGHGAVGGLMLHPVGSNGDPTFYLHHAYLDKVWWEWQQADLPARYYEMGGSNLPPKELLDMVGLDFPSLSLVEYNGDNGNVTTLHHVLYIQGLVPNVTIADVMDLGGDVICAEYIDA